MSMSTHHQTDDYQGSAPYHGRVGLSIPCLDALATGSSRCFAGLLSVQAVTGQNAAEFRKLCQTSLSNGITFCSVSRAAGFCCPVRATSLATFDASACGFFAFLAQTKVVTSGSQVRPPCTVLHGCLWRNCRHIVQAHHRPVTNARPITQVKEPAGLSTAEPLNNAGPNMSIHARAHHMQRQPDRQPLQMLCCLPGIYVAESVQF